MADILSGDEQHLVNIYRSSTGDEASEAREVLTLLYSKGIRTLDDLTRMVNEAEVNDDTSVLGDHPLDEEGEDVSKKKNKKKDKQPKPAAAQGQQAGGWKNPVNTPPKAATKTYKSWGGRIMTFHLPRAKQDITLYAGPVSNAEKMTDLDLMIDMSGSFKPAVTSTIPELTAVRELVKIDWPDGGTPHVQKDFWYRLATYIEEHAPLRIGMSCIGGRGRTGTALAVLGVMLGLNESDDPVAWVRHQYYDRAVETKDQAAYIEKMTGITVADGHVYEWSGNYYAAGSGYGAGYGGAYGGSYGKAYGSNNVYQGSGSGYVGTGGKKEPAKKEMSTQEVLQSRAADFLYSSDAVDKNQRFGIDVTKTDVFIVDRRAWEDIAKIELVDVEKIYKAQGEEAVTVALQLAEEVVMHLLMDSTLQLGEAVQVLDADLFEDPEEVAMDELDRGPVKFGDLVEAKEFKG